MFFSEYICKKQATRRNFLKKVFGVFLSWRWHFHRFLCFRWTIQNDRALVFCNAFITRSVLPTHLGLLDETLAFSREMFWEHKHLSNNIFNKKTPYLVSYYISQLNTRHRLLSLCALMVPVILNFFSQFTFFLC